MKFSKFYVLCFLKRGVTIEHFSLPGNILLTATHFLMLCYYFQGREMHHNVTAGVILSDQSLVLQGVTRLSAGEYTCLAANTEGKGTSNPETLRVMCK